MFLFDSNVLIYHLEGITRSERFFESTSPSFISVISVTELLAKPKLTKHQARVIENFLEQFNVLEFDHDIAKKAATLKRKYNLHFPDAVIAGTALYHRLTLISQDKVFKRIKGLKTFSLF